MLLIVKYFANIFSIIQYWINYRLYTFPFLMPIGDMGLVYNISKPSSKQVFAENKQGRSLIIDHFDPLQNSINLLDLLLLVGLNNQWFLQSNGCIFLPTVYLFFRFNISNAIQPLT